MEFTYAVNTLHTYQLCIHEIQVLKLALMFSCLSLLHFRKLRFSFCTLYKNHYKCKCIT